MFNPGARLNMPAHTTSQWTKPPAYGSLPPESLQPIRRVSHSYMHPPARPHTTPACVFSQSSVGYSMSVFRKHSFFLLLVPSLLSAQSGSPCSHASLDLPVAGYGISFGNSARHAGIRFNWSDD